MGPVIPDTTEFDAALSRAMGTRTTRTPNEADFLAKVVTIAERESVLLFHAYDSRKTEGKGFPDLVLCGSSRVLFAELKMPGNSLRTEQSDWRWRLFSAGAWFSVWYPRDHHSGEITRVMRWLHEPDDAGIPESLQHRSRWHQP